jgi:hypothetical protein
MGDGGSDRSQETITASLALYERPFDLEINGNGRNWSSAKLLKTRAGDGDRTRDVQLGKLDVN